MMAEDDELDDLFALHRTEIVRLKADLAEARAQIAFKDKELAAASDMTAEAHRKAVEFKAQIAAKDAALRPFADDAARLRNYPDDYPYSLPTTPITVGDLRRAFAALAAPARRRSDG